MSYRVILVHIDQSRHNRGRVELAANIAMEESAHLIGVALTGVSRFLHDTVTLNPQDPSIAPYLETLRQQARSTRDLFEQTMRQLGVDSFESRTVDEESAVGISLQARYCDLAVVGKYDPDEYVAAGYAELPGYVALHSACPVLIVPPVGQFRRVPRNIVIAWEPGVEARQAVQAALPLLRRADTVQVLVVNPPSQGARSENDIALYLSRHDVVVNIVEHHTRENIGRALLACATDTQAELLVMGCYGHTRVRELLLGGVTRTILHETTMPVLMTH